MQLLEWEIWHTYTSYLKYIDVDLIYLANQLVESGMAYLALHRDGKTVWRVKEHTGRGPTAITLYPPGNRGKFTLEREDGVELADFALEAWWQACYFRMSELRLFGTTTPLPHPYVRLILGACHLVRVWKKGWN